MQYEGVGSKDRTTEARASGANVALWIGLAVAALLGIAGLALTALSILAGIYIATH